ncbi:MAG: acetylglutamate kinase, partial [Litorimonas sp.]
MTQDRQTEQPQTDWAGEDRRRDPFSYQGGGWTAAETLSRALPFIQRHAGATVVVKLGGHAMSTPELTAEFAKDIVLLAQVGIRPVVVHGGGPQIGSMLSRLNIRTEFKDGLRVSDMETVGVAEMVLSGAINKSI